MIAGIKGILTDVSFTEIIVETREGIFYRIFIPMSTYDNLPRAGEEIVLLTYLYVREDVFHLYGFATPEEKKLFELLLSISGIGPRLALTILSSMTISTFVNAIVNADIKILSRISGIGKKSAERLVIELKDKIKMIMPEAGLVSSDGKKLDECVARAAEEAILALEQLGFKYDKVSKSVHKIVSRLSPEECSSENIIRKALAELN